MRLNRTRFHFDGLGSGALGERLFFRGGNRDSFRTMEAPDFSAGGGQLLLQTHVIRFANDIAPLQRRIQPAAKTARQNQPGPRWLAGLRDRSGGIARADADD